MVVLNNAISNNKQQQKFRGQLERIESEIVLLEGQSMKTIIWNNYQDNIKLKL
jgi:hypothetical protein